MACRACLHGAGNAVLLVLDWSLHPLSRCHCCIRFPQACAVRPRARRLVAPSPTPGRLSLPTPACFCAAAMPLPGMSVLDEALSLLSYDSAQVRTSRHQSVVHPVSRLPAGMLAAVEERFCAL